MSAPRWEDLRVAGTTTPVKQDDLPARLAPIYRDVAGRYYLPMDGELSGIVFFEHVDEAWIHQQQEEGDIRLLDPLPAHPDHVLIQVDVSSPPEYVPEAKLRDRLGDVGRSALRAAAGALDRGDRGEAERHAWYAARALPEEPLPLLVLIALLRREIPAEHLAHIERDAAAFSEQERARALDVAGGELSPLVNLILADMPPGRKPEPVKAAKPQAARPSYLDQLDDEPSFLAWARRTLASSTCLQPAYA